MTRRARALEGTRAARPSRLRRARDRAATRPRRERARRRRPTRTKRGSTSPKEKRKAAASVATASPRKRRRVLLRPRKKRTRLVAPCDPRSWRKKISTAWAAVRSIGARLETARYPRTRARFSNADAFACFAATPSSSRSPTARRWRSLRTKHRKTKPTPRRLLVRFRGRRPFRARGPRKSSATPTRRRATRRTGWWSLTAPPRRARR